MTDEVDPGDLDEIPCPECHGSAVDESGEECSVCRGFGTICKDCGLAHPDCDCDNWGDWDYEDDDEDEDDCYDEDWKKEWAEDG